VSISETFFDNCSQSKKSNYNIKVKLLAIEKKIVLY